MTAEEIREAERRNAEARKLSIDCADGVYVGLAYNPDLIRQFRDDLARIIGLWKMGRDKATSKAPRPVQIFPFRVIEGGVAKSGSAGPLK